MKTEVRQRGSARAKEIKNLKKCMDLQVGVERRDQELTLKTSEVEETVSVQTPMLRRWTRQAPKTLHDRRRAEKLTVNLSVCCRYEEVNEQDRRLQFRRERFTRHLGSDVALRWQLMMLSNTIGGDDMQREVQMLSRTSWRLDQEGGRREHDEPAGSPTWILPAIMRIVSACE